MYFKKTKTMLITEIINKCFNEVRLRCTIVKKIECMQSIAVASQSKKANLIYFHLFEQLRKKMKIVKEIV